MTTEKSSGETPSYPSIIQGGMGIGVSNWRLARAVSQRGGIGVVSGSALDTVLIRRLQDGDVDGDVRRALAAYPDQDVANAIIDKWFQEGGREAGKSYRVKALASFGMDQDELNLIIVGCFVEVYLAKENHEGWVGFNILEKTQVQSLPALLGAMIAGVDAVLMGGGIPLTIPEVLDNFAVLEPAELKLHVVGAGPDDDFRNSLDPKNFINWTHELKRPRFFPVISTDILAMTMVKKAKGRVDGFVVEHHQAGGHNAPPRRGDSYGPKDSCNLDKIKSYGLPYWLAGGQASPEALVEAQLLGAQGVQMGTIFALSDESGMEAKIKAQVIKSYYQDTLKIETDFQASPTGYPFKCADYGQKVTNENCRVCDLGYLRQPYVRGSGTLGYRCPAGPESGFVRKGGDPAEMEGKRCLCNGLLAIIGLGRIKLNGEEEPPLVTLGEDLSFVKRIVGIERKNYTVEEAMTYLRRLENQRAELEENRHLEAV